MAKVLKKAIVDGVLVLEFEKIGKSLRVNLADFPQENHKEAEEHGYLQRFGDLESGDDLGQKKYEACKELAQHYKDGGDWRMTAGSRDTTAIVLEAVHRLDPKKYPKDKLEKAAAAKPEQVKVWRANVAVRAKIAKILAERAAERAKAEEADEIEIEV